MSNVNNAALSERAVAILGDGKAPDAPVFVQVYRKLQRLITEGHLKKGDILPTENELARLTGTSRASVRSALILLFEDGYTRSYRGKGTFVTYDPAEKQRDADTDTYLLPWQRVAAAGEMSVEGSDLRMNEFDAFLDERLKLDGASTVHFSQVYALNGAHAVLACFYFPAKWPECQTVCSAEDARALLQKVFEERVATVRCTSTAVPDDGNGELDGNPPFETAGGPLLLVSSVWYDEAGAPLVYCKDYYNCGVMRFKSVFRRTPGC